MRVIRLKLSETQTPPSPGEEFYLPPDQARHGALVLRLKAGQKIELTGPCGLAPGEIIKAESKGTPKLLVRLTGPWLAASVEPGARLALALIQNQRFDWALEKAVELGAIELLPLVTGRTKRSEASAGASRKQRWRRLAEEARKQCGRPHPILLSEPMTVTDFLNKNDTGLVLCPDGPREASLRWENSPWLVIGPEGGFTKEEEISFIEAGYKKWSLGHSILRAETAALSALAKLNK